MKTLPLLGMIVLASGVLPSQASELLAQWRAEDAKASKTGITIPDKKSGSDLEVDPSTGISIGEKPPMGTDKKSIDFSGDQTAAFRTKGGFMPLTDSSVIELLLNANPSNGTDGTVLRYGSQWEIRYNASRGTLSFIVWHDNNVFTIINAPITSGKWEDVKASVDGTTIRLQVGTQSAEATLPADIKTESNKAPLIMGASRPTPPDDGTNFRQLNGKVADVRFSSSH